MDSKQNETVLFAYWQTFIDPVVLVKMLLIGYLYDIRSERRLAEEHSLNLAYRWYTGYDLDEEVPTHSVLSKARKRFGKELFLKIFEEIVEACMRAGIVKAEGVFKDSTLVRADASLDSVVEVSLPPEQYWRELEDSERPTDPRGRKPVAAEASQVGTHSNGEIAAGKMGKRRRDRNPSYLRKRSTTDPDATMHFRPATGPLLSYKAHMSVTASGIVTATTVSASAEHDTAKVPDLIDRHKKLLGQPQSVTADSAYGTEEALGYLQSQGIQTFVSPMGTRNDRGHFKKETFIYDSEQDCYTCPVKQLLKRKAKNHHTNQIVYKAPKEACAACTLIIPA